MSSPVASSYCSGPVHLAPLCVRLMNQSFSSSTTKYSFENVVGAFVHGPQKPLRSVWQLDEQDNNNNNKNNNKKKKQKKKNNNKKNTQRRKSNNKKNTQRRKRT